MNNEHKNGGMRFSLKDRVVVITGCTGVLGKAYCTALAQLGACLVLADLPHQNPGGYASELSLETGAQAIGVACDVGCENDVVALFAAALARFGRVDTVLNNAAATGEHLMKSGNLFSPFEEYPLNIWEQVLRKN